LIKAWDDAVGVIISLITELIIFILYCGYVCLDPVGNQI